MSNTEHGRFFKDTSTQNQTNKNSKTEQSPSAPNDSMEPGSETRVDDVYNELIHMRKMNRVLG